MSADVETMMWAGQQVPWHRLGTNVEKEVDSETAIKLAKLDWTVETAKLVTADHLKTSIINWRVTRRVEDQTILGVVKKNFVPIQNKDAFKFFDAVVGSKAAIYHTAGSLQGGSKVWILAKLPEPLIVNKGIGGKEDVVERYLLLSNAHDGTRPLQMLFTPVRVVCSNTLNIALMKKKESSSDEESWVKYAPRVSVRQVIGAQKKLDEQARAMKAALEYYKQFGEFSEVLYRTNITYEQVRNIVAEVFPANKKKEVTGKIQHHRTEVERLYDSGAGAENVRGTAWGLFNAFTEYADHHYAISKVKEQVDVAYSIWLGGAKGLKQRATKTIAEFAL